MTLKLRLLCFVYNKYRVPLDVIMHNSFTHSLSAQGRVFVENLRVSQLVKKFPFTRMGQNTRRRDVLLRIASWNSVGPVSRF